MNESGYGRSRWLNRSYHEESKGIIEIVNRSREGDHRKTGVRGGRIFPDRFPDDSLSGFVIWSHIYVPDEASYISTYFCDVLGSCRLPPASSVAAAMAAGGEGGRRW